MSLVQSGDAQPPQHEAGCDGELFCMKVKTQLEERFSDSYLAEDGFLLKHLQKNKLGYVSLKLLTCLKPIKALTTDWRVTLAAAERSELLEVNEERTKVRQREPPPQWLLCSPTTKLLLVWNVSEDPGPGRPSLSETLLQKFSPYGRVASVAVLRPGEDLPKELRCYAKRLKELGQRLCAVVKFERLEAVRRALGVLKAEGESDGESMCVETLGFQSTHLITKDKPREEEKQPEETPSQNYCQDSVQEEKPSPVTVHYDTTDTSRPQKALADSTQRPFDQVPGGCTGLKQRCGTMSRCSADGDKQSSLSPWVLRRKLNANVTGQPSMSCSPQRALRQPLGPDDTKGFSARGRRARDAAAGASA